MLVLSCIKQGLRELKTNKIIRVKKTKEERQKESLSSSCNLIKMWLEPTILIYSLTFIKNGNIIKLRTIKTPIISNSIKILVY